MCCARTCTHRLQARLRRFLLRRVHRARGRHADALLHLLAASCEGQEITTVEGVSEHGSLAAIQKAYGDWGGAQCGYCTPGFMMTVKHLLADESGSHGRRDSRRA